MKLAWTSKGLSDLVRLHELLLPVDPRAAASAVRALAAGAARLLEYPRLGEKLAQYEPREVRRLLIGKYETRYEIQGSTNFVLRLWHTREER